MVKIKIKWEFTLLYLIEKAETRHRLEKEEIAVLLSFDKYNMELFAAADRVREKNVGDTVYLSGVLEISNVCKKNCLYCSIRQDSSAVNRYVMTPDEILDSVEAAYSSGIQSITLQAGDNDCYSESDMSEIIKKITELGVEVTLNLDEKNDQECKAYLNAGAKNYFLSVTTTDRQLFEHTHPSIKFLNRINAVQNSVMLGYKTGISNIIGLPSQTNNSIAVDLDFMIKSGAEIIDTRPFIPSGVTPLAQEKKGSYEKALKAIAIVRLLSPKMNIVANSMLDLAYSSGSIAALRCGANMLMPNITDLSYRNLNADCENQGLNDISASEVLEHIATKLSPLNRTISAKLTV